MASRSASWKMRRRRMSSPKLSSDHRHREHEYPPTLVSQASGKRSPDTIQTTPALQLKRSESLPVSRNTAWLIMISIIAITDDEEKKLPSSMCKQVTWGHSIVADGWAGASNPNCSSTPPFTCLQIHTLKCAFLQLSIRAWRTNQRTDEASYRVACPRLKITRKEIRASLESFSLRSFILLIVTKRLSTKNKWRPVTISLRTGGQGHPTPIHTQTHPPHSNLLKKYLKRSFSHFSTRSPRTNGRTDGRTDGPTDGRTKPLIELRVRN